MDAEMSLSACIVTATIVFWASGRLPEYLVALLFFAVVAILRLVPPSVLFSGFASAAFWLILSGFVLGVAIRKVGLADRAARMLAVRLSGSWPRMVGGVVLLSYALAFIMPSNMGRIALLMPIILALADRAGLPEGGKGRAALVLAVGFGTFQLSASILPANVPNLIMAGAAENAFGIGLSYIPYLVLHGPVLGVLKGIFLTVFLCLFFPAKPSPLRGEGQPTPLGPDEKRLGALLLVTLGLWVSDGLHGISPAWVALASACICLLPRVGFLTGEEFAAGVNFRTCIYIAGILGLAAVVTQTGLGDVLGRAMLRVVPIDPERPGLSFGALAGLVAALNFAVTANGVPALYTPLAQTLADASGLPLVTVLMVQVIGYATPLLPYQAAPIVVAMGMGRVPTRYGVMVCLALAAVTCVVLVPLDYFWFRILGLIGG